MEWLLLRPAGSLSTNCGGAIWIAEKQAGCAIDVAAYYKCLIVREGSLHQMKLTMPAMMSSLSGLTIGLSTAASATANEPMADVAPICERHDAAAAPTNMSCCGQRAAPEIHPASRNYTNLFGTTFCSSLLTSLRAEFCRPETLRRETPQSTG